MTIDRWLHLSETGSNPWVLPIYAAWHQAVADARITPPPPAVIRAGLHITTRLNLIPRISLRMTSDLGVLLRHIREHVAEHHIYTPAHEARAIEVDNELKYLVIADLHAIVFELDACIDHLKLFMHALHTHVGQPLTDNQRIKMLNSWMKSKSIDPKWFGQLASARNFIAHEGAFCLATITSAGSDN